MAFTGGTEELDPISKYNAQNNEKANVSFLLFTRRNPLKPDEIILDNEESVENSEFNPQNPSRYVLQFEFFLTLSKSNQIQSYSQIFLYLLHFFQISHSRLEGGT